MRAELARLEQRAAELDAALDDVEHDTRRCNDALERAGWRSSKAEARARLLAESRQAIIADRERIGALRRQLCERLADAEERPQGEGNDG